VVANDWRRKEEREKARGPLRSRRTRGRAGTKRGIALRGRVMIGKILGKVHAGIKRDGWASSSGSSVFEEESWFSIAESD